jgi:hypothetical protein
LLVVRNDFAFEAVDEDFAVVEEFVVRFEEFVVGVVDFFAWNSVDVWEVDKVFFAGQILKNFLFFFFFFEKSFLHVFEFDLERVVFVLELFEFALFEC